MSFKEHLQFLIMMIPTLLLMAAAALTLAFTTSSIEEPASIVQAQSDD